MKWEKQKMKKKWVSFILATALLLTGLWTGGREAFAEESDFTGDEKIVVSIEGLTLGQGFYVEPTAYTFQEIIAALAKKGTTRTAAELTAEDAIVYTLDQAGYEPSMALGYDGGSYIAGIKNIDKGTVELPEILKGLVTLENNTDKDLGEYDYTSAGGWLFSEHNVSASVGMKDYVLSAYGQACTLDGQKYYVIRFMFSIYNMGADLGFEGWDSTPLPDSPWGSACPPLYEAADRSEVYAKFAGMQAAGFFSEHSEVKNEALKVMEKLDASPGEMEEAYAALQKAEEDAKNAPSVPDDEDSSQAIGETDHTSGNDTAGDEKSTTDNAKNTTAAMAEQAETTTGQNSGAQVDAQPTGDSGVNPAVVMLLLSAAGMGFAIVRKKRVCHEGKNS